MLGAGCPRVTHPFAARASSRRRSLARLACVKHAASVRPEPGSNSPWMFYDYPHPTSDCGLSTQKVTACAVSITGHTSWTFFARCTKGIAYSAHHEDGNRIDEVLLMALTFGTLLSSQGEGAHRRGPFGPSRGNLRNVTRSVLRCQPRPRTAHLALKATKLARRFTSGGPLAVADCVHRRPRCERKPG